jgi:hypothetical protein
MPPASTASKTPISSTRCATRSAWSATATVTSISDADRVGRLLEVVVLDDDGHPVAIHAMVLRQKLHDRL